MKNRVTVYVRLDVQACQDIVDIDNINAITYQLKHCIHLIVDIDNINAITYQLKHYIHLTKGATKKPSHSSDFVTAQKVRKGQRKSYRKQQAGEPNKGASRATILTARTE
jgi:hypothetical protein